MSDAEKEIRKLNKREEQSRRHKTIKLSRLNYLRIHPDKHTSYERLDEEKEFLMPIYGNPAQDAIWDPGPKQRFGKAGAWAMVTRQLPPLEGRVDKHVRVGRIFFLQHIAEADEYGFTMDGHFKALCRCPWGDVCLWPYEYSTIEANEVLDLWQKKELKFHPTNVQPARFNDIVFYARSRGIGLADAMVMALGTLSAPVGWFEPATKKLARACEEMEARVHAPWVPRRTLTTPMELKLEVR